MAADWLARLLHHWILSPNWRYTVNDFCTLSRSLNISRNLVSTKFAIEFFGSKILLKGSLLIFLVLSSQRRTYWSIIKRALVDLCKRFKMSDYNSFHVVIYIQSSDRILKDQSTRKTLSMYFILCIIDFFKGEIKMWRENAQFSTKKRIFEKTWKYLFF